MRTEKQIAALDKARRTQAANRAAKLAAAAEAKPAEIEAAQSFVEAPAGVPLSEPEAPEVPVAEPEVPSLPAELLAELSESEVAEIWATARIRAKAEKKKAAKDRAMEAALRLAREDEGLVPVADRRSLEERERLAEDVQITIRLPAAGGGSLRGVPDSIFVDQKMYRHGVTYTVPRAIYETLCDMMYRRGKAEAIFKGNETTFYSEQVGAFGSPWGGGVPRGSQPWHAGGRA